jgi:hypothetical protein
MAAEAKLRGTSQTVMVGCRLPNGIWLDFYDEHGNMVDKDGRPLTFDRKGRQTPGQIPRVRLQGNGHYLLPNADRTFKNPDIQKGAVLTVVDRDHWEKWYAKHLSHPAIMSGAIFAADDLASGLSMAGELEKQETGFERMPQNGPDVQKLDSALKPPGL